MLEGHLPALARRLIIRLERLEATEGRLPGERDRDRRGPRGPGGRPYSARRPTFFSNQPNCGQLSIWVQAMDLLLMGGLNSGARKRRNPGLSRSHGRLLTVKQSKSD